MFQLHLIFIFSHEVFDNVADAHIGASQKAKETHQENENIFNQSGPAREMLLWIVVSYRN